MVNIFAGLDELCHSIQGSPVLHRQKLFCHIFSDQALYIISDSLLLLLFNIVKPPDVELFIGLSVDSLVYESFCICEELVTLYFGCFGDKEISSDCLSVRIIVMFDETFAIVVARE